MNGRSNTVVRPAGRAADANGRQRLAAAGGLLGYGFWLVYGRPRQACADDAACARPLPNRLVKATLWAATALVAAALALPHLAPPLVGARTPRGMDQLHAT